MRALSTLLVLLAAVLTSAHATAQSARPLLTSAQDAPELLPPADETVRGLLIEFDRLFSSLRNAGGVQESNLDLLRAFDARVEAARATRPDDMHLLAIHTQVATWLKDDDAMDEGYRRLVAASGGEQSYIDAWIDHYRRSRNNDRIAEIYADLAQTYTDKLDIRLAWADQLARQARFAQAMDLLESTEFDPAEYPRSVLTLAECYMAEDRFDQIATQLDRLNEEILAADASIKARTDLARKQAEQALEEWAREQEIRSAQARVDDLPRVEFTTDRGTFTVELYENEAPNTVANFISLTERDFFDGTKFTTQIPGYSIVAGDPQTRVGGFLGGGSNPGYRIRDEFGAAGARGHFRGVLSMNKGREADSGGSLFTIHFRPQIERNGQFTAFGRVIDGLDVARSLQQNDTLTSVTVIRKRDHAYEPETLPLIGSAPATPATPPAISQPGTP